MDSASSSKLPLHDNLCSLQLRSDDPEPSCGPLGPTYRTNKIRNISWKKTSHISWNIAVSNKWMLRWTDAVCSGFRNLKHSALIQFGNAAAVPSGGSPKILFQSLATISMFQESVTYSNSWQWKKTAAKFRIRFAYMSVHWGSPECQSQVWPQ